MDRFLLPALVLSAGALLFGIAQSWPMVQLGAGLALLAIVAVSGWRALLRSLGF